MLFGNCFFVIILSAMCIHIQVTGETCANAHGDVKKFGPNCQYKCHCKNNNTCDEETGYCYNGCDVKWYGLGCQIRDLAETEVARQLYVGFSNSSRHWAFFANDGDNTTCSYSYRDEIGVTRYSPPWWRVQTPTVETIWEMTFLTKEEFLVNFKGFKVTVETAPAEKVEDKTFYPPESDVKLCYMHNNSVPSNTSIHVSCNTPLKGNLVRITLANSFADLVLCDVRVHSGCDVGLWGKTCARVCGHCLSGTCNMINGYCSGGCETGYKDTPKCNQECPSGSYGFNCSSTCSGNCASVFSDCHHIIGSCLDGCLTGWKGPRCDEECDAGFWGKNCVKVCGHCLSGTCNTRNGECSGGCEAGYKDTSKCEMKAKLNNSKDAVHFPVAGVVGGSLVAVAVILLALVFLLWRRKKRKLPKNMTDHSASSDGNYLSPAYSTALYANENIPTDLDYDNGVQTREGAYESLQEGTTDIHSYEMPTNDANQSVEERERTTELHYYETPNDDANQSVAERERTTEIHNYENPTNDANQSVAERERTTEIHNYENPTNDASQSVEERERTAELHYYETPSDDANQSVAERERTTEIHNYENPTNDANQSVAERERTTEIHNYENPTNDASQSVEERERAAELHYYETPYDDANQSVAERERTAEIHNYENPTNDANQSVAERERTTEIHNYENPTNDAYQSVEESMTDVHVYNTLQN
ncbi:multiple epidermal growth factor-like domains protein 10 isoform X2 [Ruditapes philippinarum]|uniref:multiple epidermal growth factor-like domains protein 10 isoform X2 n=1 Tax=Ruditapes philippinarum TaxID=129788 RepID=UPI00295AE447|nr:multiple epidermal growth factor-like domains protein 10 isoform X2 [Ruditapes philippinarum]